MKPIVYLILAFFLLSFKSNSVYYIDSQNGNDLNSGTNPGKAWASIDKVNQMIFQPGDKILFKAGTEYVGQLEPKGSGAMDLPIIIDKYGNGPKPAIHGKGKKLYTLLLHNVEYWEVRNLEITNTGDEREADRRGVYISAENFGDCHHIILDSLEIHHVNGSLVKKDGGGSAILWQNSGDKIKTRFVDLIIENCYLHHCERNGINSKGNTNRNKWYPSIGVIIRNNLLEQIPGDGIVPIGCDGAIVENNILRDSPDILPHAEAAAGIWPWSSDNTVIQFNEVSDQRAKWDGQGFDSDYNCIGTIIQYNYSHDNWGGFLLVCCSGESFGTSGNIGTKNSIIRYNVSINDGLRTYPTRRLNSFFSPVMNLTGPIENTKIYNNIIILPKKENKDIDTTLVNMDNWGGPWPKDTWFANNVFYVYDQSVFKMGESINTKFMNNAYFGNIKNLPDDKNAVFENPSFVNSEARGSGFELLKAFMLKKNSPLIGKGIKEGHNNLKDLFGNPVRSGKVNIGVHQF
jgi:hypothetical protein